MIRMPDAIYLHPASGRVVQILQPVTTILGQDVITAHVVTHTAVLTFGHATMIRQRDATTTGVVLGLVALIPQLATMPVGLHAMMDHVNTMVV
jgi:hypothetical protein